MRFEEAYEGWSEGRLTQAAAAQILGMCERSFRRYLSRYEAAGRRWRRMPILREAVQLVAANAGGRSSFCDGHAPGDQR